MDEKKPALGEKIRNMSRAEKEAYVEYLNSDECAIHWYGHVPSRSRPYWTIIEEKKDG